MAELTTNTNTDLNLWELLKSSESGGGGGGGGSISSFDITAGINASADINTIIARLSAIEVKLQGGYKAAATIQRAADITTYATNDVYGSSFELTNIGSSGGFILLSGIKIIFNIAALPVGMGGFLLYLYTTPPPSDVQDNGAFSVPVGDRGALITPMGIDLGSAVLAVGGGSVVLNIANINEEFKLATGSTSLFGYLVTRGAFTPAATSETASLIALSIGV